MTRAGFLAAALSTALALSLGACSDDSGQAAPAPGTPPAAGPGGVPAASDTARVRHILIGIKGTRLKTGRSEEQALELSKALIADLAAGRRTFEELITGFTDDRDPEGKPNAAPGLPPGTYVVYRVPPDPRRDFVKAFKDAAFSTPVGQVAPEPVKTQFGYHIIRREK